MSSPFIGQITMFGGNFAPAGWAKCDGALLAINSYTALFSILGTTYGGNGQTTFGLPDLRSRSPMHAGNGPGLTNRPLGQKSGNENFSLATANLPAHTHTATATAVAKCQSNAGDGNSPVNKVWSKDLGTQSGTYRTGPGNSDMAAGAVEVTVTNADTGIGSPVSHQSPYQCVTFIIALQGVFPSQN